MERGGEASVVRPVSIGEPAYGFEFSLELTLQMSFSKS